MYHFGFHGGTLRAWGVAMALIGFTPSIRAGSDSDGRDWGSYGRAYDEIHYSPLSDVNASTVSRLGLAWWFDIPGIVLAESVPLEVNGTMYFATGYSVVRAVDAATGRLLWVYDPGVTKVAGRKLRLLWGVRGIAFWNHKVYVGTHDGRLIAVDANSGKAVWSVVTNERPDDFRVITGPPLSFNGKIVVGHASSEFGPVPGHVSARGYVTAYDAETGKKLWRFFTVPGNPAKGFENKAMEMAAKTWTGKWWKDGGGGTVWNAMTYDPELNRVYIGTSNGTPTEAKARSPQGGDNLFLACIIALDADTGAYLWHYQANPNPDWDYDATDDIELTDLVVDGVPRRVLMQASKNGFFYVIDRDSGKLISAEKFAKATWADRVDPKSGRPVETAEARDHSTQLWPDGEGAHSWAPMAFNPTTALTYIPELDSSTQCNDAHLDSNGNYCLGTSYLLGWDPRKQQARWRNELSGIRNGGVLTTGGNLVFQGRNNGQFVAYAADTGQVLWSFDAQVGLAAAPISYQVSGRQYVSVMAGYGGGGAVIDPRWDARTQQRRVLTFALDADRRLPPGPSRHEVVPVSDARYKPDASAEKLGATEFLEHCTMCHGYEAVAGGAAPELRESYVILSSNAFRKIVKDGGLLEYGMPRFKEISDVTIENIRQYLRSRAMDLRRVRGGTSGDR